MSSILIKSARVIDPASQTDEVLDVLIENKRITRLAKNIEKSAKKILDARGLIVCPGFIDIHVHLRDPGYEYKETIETACKAAIAGGITSIFSMPNTDPVADDISVIEYIKTKQEKVGLADIYPVAALTSKSSGHEITEMKLLSNAGAIAFSDDGNNIDNSQVMRKALEYIALTGKPVLVHAEDNALADSGQINEGIMSTKLGLKGIPSIAEESVIFRDIGLARYTKAHVHFMHLSTAGSVKLVRDAKQEGLNITCEVTPHHLLLDDSSLDSYDTNLKVKPPLRTKEDRDALVKGLIDGTIDCIASDHAPHAKHEKEVEFDYAAFGMVGLETMFNLLFTNIKDDIGLSLLVEKLTSSPAKIFNLEKGSISEGKIADIAIINPKRKAKVDSSRFFSKSKNTPFDGFNIESSIDYTIKNGTLVYELGKFLNKC